MFRVVDCYKTEGVKLNVEKRNIQTLCSNGYPKFDTETRVVLEDCDMMSIKNVSGEVIELEYSRYVYEDIKERLNRNEIVNIKVNYLMNMVSSYEYNSRKYYCNTTFFGIIVCFGMLIITYVVEKS